MSIDEHRNRSPRAIAVYIVTFSDTRDESSDATGAGIRVLLENASHRVVGKSIWREEAETLRVEMERLLQRDDFEVVVVNGGTGVAPRDLAYDILAPLYEREIPGFGELFRALSYAEIGSAAMLSRASAGVAHGKLVFSVPGSAGAARLALEKLILPELGHLVGELRRDLPGKRAS